MTTFGSKADKEGLMEWRRLTVADNRRYNVSSLVLIDVCAQYLLNGQLPIMDLLTNGRSMWLTVMSLHVPDPGAVGQRRAREHGHRAVLQVDYLHRVGGKAVGARGPGQGVQVGDAVPARQALGWSDQHR
jgi:hypothetical protein